MSGLDVGRLAQDIVNAMERQMPPEETLPSESEEFANDLADAIHRYVSAAQVVGIEVQVEALKYDQVGKGELQ